MSTAFTVSPQNNRLSLSTQVGLLIAFSFLIRLAFMMSHGLLVQEAYYWNYAQHLDFGYLDHPPMVAVLIYLSTKIFGMAEWAVRLGAVACWLVAAYFVYQWSELMSRGTGRLAVLLLSVLPFFFILSLIITPDIILTACWAAACYYLYRALLLEEAAMWYGAGLSLGLGMLSKYTIVLLGPAIFMYLFMVPNARQWFARKEPYIAFILALLVFTPVIYWNATHDWVSFAFQSTRRFGANFRFGLPAFLGLLLLFVTPLGLKGLYQLLKRTGDSNVSHDARFFLFCFTLIPLGFFAVFSLSHQIKFDWIGPTLLPLLPWFASQKKHVSAWRLTSIALLLAYSVLFMVLMMGLPHLPQMKVLNKVVDWRAFTIDMNQAARQIEIDTKTTPYLVPLDPYNTNSVLAYYQTALVQSGQLEKPYPQQAAHVFGMNSLMYHYWLPMHGLEDKTLILISSQLKKLNILAGQAQIQGKVKTIWTQRPNSDKKAMPFYYQAVKLRAKPSVSR